MTTTRKTVSRDVRTDVAHITLAAQAAAMEHARHARRMAELKAMHARLRLLDAYMPAIRAAGINVHGEELHSWGGRAINVMAPVLNPKRNATLERVLRDCGLREVRRSDYLHSYSVELRKGHLIVALTVDTRPLPKAQEATKCA